MNGLKLSLRTLLAFAYALAGYLHLVRPEPFLTITPAWVPCPHVVIYWTGIAEIAGAIGLVQPVSKTLRRPSGAALALYALCVWPANINHMLMDMERADGGLGLIYHVPRMMLQPVLIWLALWLAEVPMPWAKRRK